jgi:uncharacterized cofD-like protein
MRSRVTVLGGGHGSASVIRALRGDPHDLNVIVTTADDGGSSGQLRRLSGGPAVGDLRRALLSVSAPGAPLARAFGRIVDVTALGQHRLGNVVICSIADALGDLQAASDWLAAELGASGRVLPATLDPVALIAETADGVIEGESAIGTTAAPVHRLRFDPPRPRVSDSVRDAIADADWVLLAPGSLFTSVLAVCALSDVVSALAATRAHVAWICNLAEQPGETTGMTALDHLRALRSHDVRADAVIYDPGAEVHFTPTQLARARVEAIPRPLRTGRRDVHDPQLLRAALKDLFASSFRDATRLAAV